jgi:hypothetical protein
MAANERAHRGKSTLRTEVYMHLRMDHPKGRTCAEMAVHFKKPMHAISGRISELKENGLVIATDETRNGGRVVVADCHFKKQMSLGL